WGIHGNRAPTCPVFKLTDPLRLVIDLAGADISAAAAPTDGVGPILGVTARQFSNEKLSVGRVTIAMAEGAGYDVKSRGNDVVVQIVDKRAPAETAKAPKVPAPQEPAASPAQSEPQDKPA